MVEGLGLSIQATVCPKCKFRDGCMYLAMYAEARSSPHRIVTHKRASFSMKTVSDDRKLILIHEDPTDLLRPKCHVYDPVEFEKVAAVSRRAGTAAFVCGDDDMSKREFFYQMESAAIEIARELREATFMKQLRFPPASSKPFSLHSDLYSAVQVTERYSLTFG